MLLLGIRHFGFYKYDAMLSDVVPYAQKHATIPWALYFFHLYAERRVLY